MNPKPSHQLLVSDLSGRKMTLNLFIRPGQQIVLRSSEVFGDGYRHRLSFQKDRSIDNVLIRELATAIRTSLRSIPQGAYVLSQPEFLFELPGLALRGLHVMVTEAKDGMRSAILRFRQVIGSASHAFSKNVGMDDSLPSDTEKLALNVLADICMPILNLCQTLEEIGRPNGHLIQNVVLGRAGELQFHMELLKRFVHNAQNGHAPAPEVHLTAGRQMAPLRLKQ